MLSRPGALPDFNFLMAASSSSTLKSEDRLASAVAALDSEVTSRDVQCFKFLSVTGHVECVVLLPVSLFMVCHALRLECMKSTDRPEVAWTGSNMDRKSRGPEVMWT